ncbi:MAG: LysM peptidoglycan-binding domain-containing protein, partial [Nocardioides sp.]
ALAACWLWLAACVGLVVVRVLREGAAAEPPPRVRGCPRLVHALLLLALGVGAAAPAVAAPEPARSGSGGQAPGISGLALPDRVRATAAPPDTVRVRPGDSLWLVAQRLLPDGADDAAVDRAWRRLAACNADRLGPDPDLIVPGTLLRVPASGRALGKDDR